MPKRKHEQTNTDHEHPREPDFLCKIRRSERLKKPQHRVFPSPLASTSTQSNTQRLKPSKRAATRAHLQQLPRKAETQLPYSTARNERKHNTELSWNAEKTEGRHKRPKSLKCHPTEDRRRLHLTPQVYTPDSDRSLAGAEVEPVGIAHINQRKKIEPLEYWVMSGTWPAGLAKGDATASNSSGKRKKSASTQSRSYSQSRQAGEVPEQFTKEYESELYHYGVDMDVMKGQDLVADTSVCSTLRSATAATITLTTFSRNDFRKIISSSQRRNEAYICRTITQIISPPIIFLYLNGDSFLEHIIDEANANWNEQYIIYGPRIRPDLTIGLAHSAFTKAELDKLKRYTNANNWTQFTTELWFPFLTIETKCGKDSLDIADRQNMHSGSVAVKAILQIEQEADKYRRSKILGSLNGEILAYSLSHDHRNFRFYGHYAIIKDNTWKFYRYLIESLDMLVNMEYLRLVFNLVQNVLKTQGETHLQRLQNALAVMPDPKELASGLSFNASELAIEDQQQIFRALCNWKTMASRSQESQIGLQRNQ